MAGAADAEDLQINAADGVDGFFILAAVVEDLIARDGSLGDVDVLLRDVDMVEQLVRHEPRVALGVVGREAVVFVEIEGDDVLEAESFFLVKADQLTIERHGRGACGHPEHGGFACFVLGLNELPHFLGQFLGGLGGVFENEGGDLFKGFCGGAASGHGWLEGYV